MYLFRYELLEESATSTLCGPYDEDLTPHRYTFIVEEEHQIRGVLIVMLKQSSQHI